MALTGLACLIVALTTGQTLIAMLIFFRRLIFTALVFAGIKTINLAVRWQTEQQPGYQHKVAKAIDLNGTLMGMATLSVLVSLGLWLWLAALQWGTPDGLIIGGIIFLIVSGLIQGAIFLARRREVAGFLAAREPESAPADTGAKPQRQDDSIRTRMEHTFLAVEQILIETGGDTSFIYVAAENGQQPLTLGPLALQEGSDISRTTESLVGLVIEASTSKTIGFAVYQSYLGTALISAVDGNGQMLVRECAYAGLKLDFTGNTRHEVMEGIAQMISSRSKEGRRRALATIEEMQGQKPATGN